MPKSTIKKKIAIKLFKTAKIIINKNSYAKSTVVKIKNVLIGEDREVYDFHKYYPTIIDYREQQVQSERFRKKPLISILIPTYNTPIAYLKECIESVIYQSYSNWELCIADDNSNNKETTEFIKKIARTHNNIKFKLRNTNGHISIASNTALDMATGDFVLLLDHDDVLWPNALYEIAKVINEDKKIDFIYSDEDKINSDSSIHSYPFLKPDWSPEFLESCNYITHLACIKTELVKKADGFRQGYEGAQDWDLFMRVAEITSNIRHIPKILYSWRIHDMSTASSTDAKPYVYEAQRKLLIDHVQRINKRATVSQGIIWQHSVIAYEIDGKPLVQIAVENTINFDKIIKKCGYDRYIIVNTHDTNNIPQTIKKFDNKSDFFVILPKDIIDISDGWLAKLIPDCQRPGVGFVGGQVLNSSGTKIESAGYGIGLGGSCLPLLRGVSVDDNHYMRGLYSKSRRNISATDAPIIIGKKVMSTAKSEANSVVDVCLIARDMGLRGIYNPFVTTNVSKYTNIKPNLSNLKKKLDINLDYDPFLNPNYRQETGLLEIR